MERGIFAIVDTESLVPAEHLLRKIDAAVDFNISDESFYTLDPVVLSNIEEELRFYFEDDYVGAFAGNPMNYEYLQKAEEYLLRSGKKIVSSVNPGLMVKPVPDGVVFDETYPLEKQYTLAGQTYSVHDAFGKLVGSSETEYVHILQAWAPTEKDAEDGFWAIPLMFFSTYELSAAENDENCAFIHGQIVSFAELEPYKVYEDDFFVCYNVTHLFYTDLRAYVEEIVSMNTAIEFECYYDEQVFTQVENILNYYQENLEIASWNECLDLIPDCSINRDQTSSELVRDGLLSTALPAAFCEMSVSNYLSPKLKNATGALTVVAAASSVTERFLDFVPCISIIATN